MTLGALIGAYQEGEGGALAALTPLAGRTLVEYQARCAAAAGASPIVILVETVPIALAAAFERLRAEGVNVVPVSDGNEAAARFEPHSLILQMADGMAPAFALVERLAGAGEAVVATVPDDSEHEHFERIDNDRRWAGLAVAQAGTLSSTASMLGDWDLQSTLLRRTIQAGALPIAVGAGLTPFLANSGGGDAQQFDRKLLIASRRARRDWPSRFVFPPIEEFATERLMHSPVRPSWLVIAALAMIVAAAVCFSQGWAWPALVLLLLASPLELVAERLGQLRLQPLASASLARRLLWPASGVALIALGWWEAVHGSGWGALVAALGAAAFGEAQRNEAAGPNPPPFETWLFSWRSATLVALPFAALGAWDVLLAALAVYAMASFFLVQHWVHRPNRD